MQKNGKSVDEESLLTLHTESLGLRRNGKWLIRNLNLEVDFASSIAILGPSGVGKTSFLKCLAGDLEPTEGGLYYRIANGIRKKPHEIRTYLGFIFQNLNLIENESVLYNVLVGRLSRYSSLRTLLGFPCSDKHDAFAILNDLGIGECVHKWVAEISGGEKQRVSIARALFQNPSIVFADEPFSHLDSQSVENVLTRFRKETKDRNKTVFCVLHDSDFVDCFADFILTFNQENPENWTFKEVLPK